MGRTYIETFDDSAGGWVSWISNAAGPGKLERRDSAIISRSPWWIDYNHAPPGAGYLHLLAAMQTAPHFNLQDRLNEVGGENRFISGGFSRDFTNARMTLRLRGDLDLRGAQLLLHCQAIVNGRHVNQSLIGQPFQVTKDWSEQSIDLLPDPALWCSLGTRSDRHDFYGHAGIDVVLRNLNNNIILILFPLNVVPCHPTENPHALRAGEDYAVERSQLPSGFVMIDEVRIAFSGA